MPGKLATEIKQSKPFRHLEAEAFLNLLRTTDALLEKQAQLLDRYELSHAQYNVLRILRGAGADGLPCGEIAARMITRDPDVTRLLDRLEKRGLAQRSRDSRDRRVVTARISPPGLDLLKQLDPEMERLHQQTLGHLGKANLNLLIGLLEQARENCGR